MWFHGCFEFFQHNALRKHLRIYVWDLEVGANSQTVETESEGGWASLLKLRTWFWARSSRRYERSSVLPFLIAPRNVQKSTWLFFQFRPLGNLKEKKGSLIWDDDFCKLSPIFSFSDWVQSVFTGHLRWLELARQNSLPMHIIHPSQFLLV
jgi:hypothetical protein